jgi:hypothetical protein
MSRWRFRFDRPWWRKLLALPAGPCWHVTHEAAECEATWQRCWPEDWT